MPVGGGGGGGGSGGSGGGAAAATPAAATGAKPKVFYIWSARIPIIVNFIPL